jgi:hypothetical protein
MTERDEPGLLTAGLRYGGPSRRRWWRRLRRRPRTEPQASWILQYFDTTGWTLRLRSSTPGDLELPLAFANRDVPASDREAAHEWALSVLPAGVEHTVSMVSERQK